MNLASTRQLLLLLLIVAIIQVKYYYLYNAKNKNVLVVNKINWEEKIIKQIKKNTFFPHPHEKMQMECLTSPLVQQYLKQHERVVTRLQKEGRNYLYNKTFPHNDQVLIYIGYPHRDGDGNRDSGFSDRFTGLMTSFAFALVCFVLFFFFHFQLIQNFSFFLSFSL